MLLWALAKGGGHEGGVMGRVADHVLLHVDNFTLTQLSTAAWALAHAQQDAVRFLAGCSNRVMQLLRAATSSNAQGPQEAPQGGY